MIDDGNGGYKESTTDTFPGYEYFYNQTKSSCMDMAGKPIADSLLYNQDTKTASITVGDTSSCYLYFDNYTTNDFASHLTSISNLYSTGLDGDGYRFSGVGVTLVSTPNFMCFGTTSRDECLNNEDKYMYRIIGVFNDASGNKNVKLIKFKSIGDYMWDSHYAKDVNWEDSDLYKGLNGSYFLTNTTYDYLQDTVWNNKIEDWTWSAVNTKTYSDDGEDYISLLSNEIYLHEMNNSNKKSSIGSWTTPTGKIGLMYISDYMLSRKGITGDSSSIKNELLQSWINGSKVGYINEWTMSRVGTGDGAYSAYNIADDASLIFQPVFSELPVRPVFYLKKDVDVTSSGDGQHINPFIIDLTEKNNKLSVQVSNSGMKLNAIITKGTGNLKKYCISTKSDMKSCEWKSVTNTSISYTMTEYKQYFVYVIDDEGFIARGSLNFEPRLFNAVLFKDKNLWQTNLDGDGYRFIGTGSSTSETSPKNFVCFGTTNKSDCTNNPNKYMYRVIGIFPDSDGVQHIKLIKYSSLDTYKWNTNAYTSDISWKTSTLNSGLNGEHFLTNTTYDYMQDTKWINKIENWTWSSVNTKAWDGSGSSGLDYAYNSVAVKSIYLHEMNRSTKTSTVGEWTTSSGKIGLMYVSDYLLSMGENYLSSISKNTDYANTWIGNKWGDNSELNTLEWTISQLGTYLVNNINRGYYAYTIKDDGTLGYTSVLSAINNRPVFYLSNNIYVYPDGEGTISNPYIIDN